MLHVRVTCTLEHARVSVCARICVSMLEHAYMCAHVRMGVCTYTCVFCVWRGGKKEVGVKVVSNWYRDSTCMLMAM